MTRENAVKFVDELRWLMQLQIQSHRSSDIHEVCEKLVSLLTDDVPVFVNQRPAHDRDTGLWNPSL